MMPMLGTLDIDSEAVVVSQSTEIHNLKCLLVLACVENSSLREELASLRRFRDAARDLASVSDETREVRRAKRAAAAGE